VIFLLLLCKAQKANKLMMQHKELYLQTINKWGAAAQYNQAVEECAELITSLQHFARGKVDGAAVVDELADVYLMVGQLTYMFGEEQLAAAVEKKIAKLQRLLDDGE
jgi:NTP pyrophosphatase (non-canonical NTP hydrolase)